MPYATIDNKVSMTAMDASDPSGVQYYFHCTAGGLPDSGWQDSATYVTAAVADGSYSFQYKLRDKSTQNNESGYSTTYSATIESTTGYHACTFAQVSTLPDDYLVTFNGIVIGVNADNYVVRDPASSATATVKPDTYGQATDAANLFKNVTVSGHLYTLSGVRLVTYAHVTATGSATQYTISGKVTNSSGVGIAGATVYFSTGPGAATNPICTATTDANGNYSRSIINGTWYVAVTAPDYYPSADQVVVVNGANVPNINFTLIAMPKISGKVTTSDGTPMAGATVCFAQVPGATVSPIFTVTTDANGNYSRGVNGNTTWYVAAKAPGYGPSSGYCSGGGDFGYAERQLRADPRRRWAAGPVL